jgi:hypothetical protein
MAFQDSTYLYFNGTGLQMFHDLDTCYEFADNCYKKMKSINMTDEEIRSYVIRELSTMEREICDHFGEYEYDTKELCKFWGALALKKYKSWSCCVIIGLKIKLFKNDDKNGTLVRRDSVEGLLKAGYKAVAENGLWQPCSNEGCKTPHGNFKKCSKCKKVRYCCRECQVADWKKHKPDCC